ncbi:MAG: D-alanyl-D-alanine carboxypeptidase family protein [Lachnospiraceae bacterium]|nr:D-alanyl-D-alanine carboxypeptidase family protein [Lachnospiraceae bacterium]
MKYKRLALFMAIFYLISSITVFASEDTSAPLETSTEAVSNAASVTSGETSTESAAPLSDEESGIKEESDRGTTITTGSEEGLELVGEGVVLMEAKTGAILYSKNADQQFYPASITKIMTTLVALENGNLTDELTFQADTLNAIEQDSSRVGVVADETMTLESALYGVMLASGNDCAAGVAEYIGGSVDAFVEMMNAKAEELGCSGTHFTNPHGLNDENHYTCAKDMALIMQAAIQNPDFCTIASSKTYTIPATNKSEARELWNHSKILLPASEYHYDGACEGKTGYTSDAWNTLVTTAERDGMKLIAVILHCQGAAAAYNDTTTLFDYGFNNYTTLKPLENLTLSNIAEASNLSVGETSNLEALNPYYNKDYSILAPTSVAVSDILVTMTNDGQDSGVWGSIYFTYNDQEIGSAHIYYDADSDIAAAVQDSSSTKAKTTSLVPYVVTVIIIILVLIIIFLSVSILKRRK